MKHLYLTPLALACTLAHAQTSTSEWHLQDSTGKDIGTYSTQTACDSAARALTPANTTKLYGCPRMLRVQGKVVATPPPPAPPPPPPPPAPAPVPAPPPAPAPSPAPAPASNMPVVDASKIPARNTADVRYAPRRAPTADTVNTASDMGAFRLGCSYSHMGFYDPLVNPGNEGPDLFHLHVFFGNAGITKDSTSDLLATTGGSTCSGGTLNRSSYWAPAVIDTTDGSPVQPAALLVYYKSGYGGVRLADIKPVPKGLHMISGSAGGNPASPSGAGRFACVGGAVGVGWQATIPTTCNNGNQMIMEVGFPQCWDGLNLDSADHKAHMAEATGQGCPVTHPVAIAAISFEIYYDLSKVNIANMAKWRLSSDNYPAAAPGGYSSHADYMFAWDAATIAAVTKNCNNVPTDCHANLVGDGTKLLAPSDPDGK